MEKEKPQWLSDVGSHTQKALDAAKAAPSDQAGHLKSLLPLLEQVLALVELLAGLFSKPRVVPPVPSEIAPSQADPPMYLDSDEVKF